MRAAVLAVLCGCGFHVGAQAPLGDASEDGGDDDASGPAIDAPIVTIDAAVDSPVLPTIDAPLPAWTVIEALPIPVANGAQVTSTMSLALGITYHLRVSGSYVTDDNVIPNTLADAEYYDYAAPKDVTPIGTPIDVGVGIDDATSDASKQPSWGQYTSTHVYEVTFVGKGAPIKANIHDGNYANDSGMLKLEILALQ